MQLEVEFSQAGRWPAKGQTHDLDELRFSTKSEIPCNPQDSSPCILLEIRVKSELEYICGLESMFLINTFQEISF